MPSRNRVVSLPKKGTAKGLDLAASRQRKGISLQQVVDATKISMRYLLAIESEAFQELPGGVFANNYLRQYAEASGFDAGRLLKQYAEKVTNEAESIVEAPSESRGFFWRLFRPAV